MMIDHFGRYILRIPDQLDGAIGGHQRLWIRPFENSANDYQVSMLPTFDDPWNVKFSIINDQLVIARDCGLKFYYRPVEMKTLTEDFLCRRTKILKKMVHLETINEGGTRLPSQYPERHKSSESSSPP